jgi:hypothetical protein
MLRPLDLHFVMEGSLSSKYDIFVKTPEAPLTWIETIEDIYQAKKRLISLASSRPGDYFIWDLFEHRFIEGLEETPPVAQSMNS